MGLLCKFNDIIENRFLMSFSSLFRNTEAKVYKVTKII